jgi:TonB family protein
LSLRILIFFLFAVARPLGAQNLFVAIDDGPKVVKAVRGRSPMIDTKGKLGGTSTHEFALAKAIVYRPGLVTLSNFKVGVHVLQDGRGNRYNFDMKIYGEAKADVDFKNCFLVLELKWGTRRGWLFAELPDLPAGRQIDFNYTFPLAEHVEQGAYNLHVFADGIEVLHSKMRSEYLAFQKQKTADLMSGKTRDYAPVVEDMGKLVYPPELKTQKLAGSAHVRCAINAHGDVVSCDLVDATHPAFGAAALAAVPKWKFDPAIKDRHLVESTVIVPVEFKPPAR